MRTLVPMAPKKQVVLVVEDEPLLRMMAVDMVEEAGYDAIEAAGAMEAISILEARSDIRLVFTDIDMPGGPNGVWLAACIRDRWPPVEIIVTSGHATEREIELPDRSVFFAKPYRRGEVVATMHRMVS